MSGERHSEGQVRASRAQSKADRTGAGKQAARRLQSQTDQAAVTKHGE